MDLGTGIIIGCATLGGFGTMWKIFSNRSSNKYVSLGVFNATIRAMDQRFTLLNETMKDGFENLNGNIREVHKRIDKILDKQDD